VRPSGTIDNSPAVHCWVKRAKTTRSPVGTAEQRRTSTVPTGHGLPQRNDNPAVNCWAIVGTPSGREVHQRRHYHRSLSRSFAPLRGQLHGFIPSSPLRTQRPPAL